MGLSGDDLGDCEVDVDVGLEVDLLNRQPCIVCASISLMPLTLALIEYWL